MFVYNIYLQFNACNCADCFACFPILKGWLDDCLTLMQEKLWSLGMFTCKIQQKVQEGQYHTIYFHDGQTNLSKAFMYAFIYLHFSDISLELLFLIHSGGEVSECFGALCDIQGPFKLLGDVQTLGEGSFRC
jgi:hypothetical protein